jgi:3-oxoacid CoA-transferase subunit B
MQHVNKSGESKLLNKCSLPITGLGCVKKVVTELGVFDVTPEGFKCIEYAPGVSIDYIKEKTIGRLVIADDVKEMNID